MEANVRSRELLGWHFLPKDRHLRYAPYVTVHEGKTLSLEGPVELCVRGFHASERALDAVCFAPGPIACRVRLSGDIVVARNQSCASERTALWIIDATALLHELMHWCAEHVLAQEREAGREPDQRLWTAVASKRRTLERSSIDPLPPNYSIWTAAWNAAWETTDAGDGRSPSWYAVWHAAETAAEASAWHAPWYAVRATAEAAANYAAYRAVEMAVDASDTRRIWESAREATWHSINEELEKRLMLLGKQKGLTP